MFKLSRNLETAITATPTMQLVKDVIRNPYAFPGGYEKFAVTNDGSVLCQNCLKSEFRVISHSTRFAYNDGWDVAAIDYTGNCEPGIDCDHCSRNLL